MGVFPQLVSKGSRRRSQKGFRRGSQMVFFFAHVAFFDFAAFARGEKAFLAKAAK